MIDLNVADADGLDAREDARLRGMRGPPSLAFRVEFEGRTVRLVPDVINEGEELRLRTYVRPLASEIILRIADLLETWAA